MQDFSDTVPVDMSGLVGVQCDNCGAMNDPFEVGVESLTGEGVSWVCTSCGGHNFQAHDDDGAEELVEATAEDGEEVTGHIVETGDGFDYVCLDCGALIPDSDFVFRDDGDAECPHCHSTDLRPSDLDPSDDVPW